MTQEVKQVDLTTDISKASYSIGFEQVQGISGQTQGLLDVEAFGQGVADAVSGADRQVDPELMMQLMQSFQQAVASKQNEAQAAVLEEAAAYRETFAAKDGVVTLPSGLMYEVITAGEGAKPAASDTVVTHYHGMLISGEVFDSSVERGTPASFAVNGVIPGWTEALQLMPVGSKWRLVIPPELAYGERGAGGKIGPNATLVFEVELLEIKG